MDQPPREDFIAPGIAVAIYRTEKANDNIHDCDWNAAVHGPPDRADELLSTVRRAVHPTWASQEV